MVRLVTRECVLYRCSISSVGINYLVLRCDIPYGQNLFYSVWLLKVLYFYLQAVVPKRTAGVARRTIQWLVGTTGCLWSNYDHRRQNCSMVIEFQFCVCLSISLSQAYADVSAIFSFFIIPILVCVSFLRFFTVFARISCSWCSMIWVFMNKSKFAWDIKQRSRGGHCKRIVALLLLFDALRRIRIVI